MSKCKCALIILVGLIVASIFLAINFGIYSLIWLVIGGILAKGLILLAYYFSARLLVRLVAFPGSFYISRRKLEF